MHVTLDKSDTNNFERGSYNGDHPLGDSITTLLDEFERNYIYYVETQGAYSTKEKKIEKPEIYLATNKLLKAYKKDLKKERIEEWKAREELYTILNNVNKLKNYQTDNLELLLSESKNVDEIKHRLLNLKFLD